MPSKVPCRSWAQCSKYNSKVWRDIHPEIINEELHDWYNTHFKIVYEYSDILGNG